MATWLNPLPVPTIHTQHIPLPICVYYRLQQIALIVKLAHSIMCDYMLNSDVNYREQSKELAQKPKARNGIIHTANLGIIQ